jgi:YVTN family beta-propeller protein
MTTGKSAIFILPFLLLTACSLFDNGSKNNSTAGSLSGRDGVFIINEGNFNAGNGSLSFFAFDSLKTYNDLFSSVNSRPLGDVPYSMAVSDDKAYIVVNNSGKIEVADVNTLKSLATITGLNSPRNILFISSTKAYVTSLWSTEMSVVNLVSDSVKGSIRLRRSSEAILKSGDKAYISCWVSGSEIMVVNTVTDQVIDSIAVGHEPESMVFDKNDRLWVLCSGGYSGEYFPELISINTSTGTIDKRLVFPSKSQYPTTLRINNTGDTLFYLENGIWMMPVASAFLPDHPLVKSMGRTFYKLGVRGTPKEIFATNVLDYTQRGYLLRFAKDGTVIDSSRTDIIPGDLFFKKK